MFACINQNGGFMLGILITLVTFQLPLCQHVLSTIMQTLDFQPHQSKTIWVFFHWQPYFLGTKVTSFVSGPKAPRRGTVYDGLMHISDWYPTILSAAGLKTPRGLDLNGHNQWPAIKGRRQQSPRKVDLKIKSQPKPPKN